MDDDRILDLSPPLTEEQRRKRDRHRAKVRPIYEKIARRKLGDAATQELVDEHVETMFAGGRVSDERLDALTAAAALGLPIALYDRLMDELTLRVGNKLRFAKLGVRFRLLAWRQELLDRMQDVPASSPARRDAEALCHALERRIKELTW